MKELKETHPSLEIQTILSGKPFVWAEEVQEKTRDIVKIKEALKKHLTSEYEGQLAVMPEYYKIMKELDLQHDIPIEKHLKGVREYLLSLGEFKDVEIKED